MGALKVQKADDGSTHVTMLWEEVSVSWVFTQDGVFKNIMFGSGTNPLSASEVEGAEDRTATSVLVCEHIEPGYQGPVYRRRVMGVNQVLCPDCVRVGSKQAVEVLGEKVRVITEELWDAMSEGIVITDLEDPS